MWYTVLAVIIPIIALVLSFMTYVYRTTPSLSAHFDTKLYIYGTPYINYGGVTPIAPGEQYLELILINFGPGIAKNVKWDLKFQNYDSKKYQLMGSLPFIMPNVPTTVQGFLRIEHNNRKEAANKWKQDNSGKSLETPISD